MSPTPDIDYKAVRRGIEAEVKKQNNFAKIIFLVVNVIMFIAFSVIAWSMAGSAGINPGMASNMPGVQSGDPIASALIMLNMGWFAGLIFQGLMLFFDTKIGERQIRERATGKIMNQALLDAGLADESEPEKAKRAMRLTDDGELEEVEGEDELILAQKRVRGKS